MFARKLEKITNEKTLGYQSIMIGGCSIEFRKVNEKAPLVINGLTMPQILDAFKWFCTPAVVGKIIVFVQNDSVVATRLYLDPFYNTTHSYRAEQVISCFHSIRTNFSQVEHDLSQRETNTRSVLDAYKATIVATVTQESDWDKDFDQFFIALCSPSITVTSLCSPSIDLKDELIYQAQQEMGLEAGALAFLVKQFLLHEHLIATFDNTRYACQVSSSKVRAIFYYCFSKKLKGDNGKIHILIEDQLAQKEQIIGIGKTYSDAWENAYDLISQAIDIAKSKRNIPIEIHPADCGCDDCSKCHAPDCNCTDCLVQEWNE